jgi:2-polyprenyl-3-methyl-5-hydroxy-6-metoxy-1,4-benzoquinol methylase
MAPTRCPVCSSECVLETLQRRPDHEYAVAVQLHYWRCRECSHVFAAPAPSETELLALYARYSTHPSEQAHAVGLRRWLDKAIAASRSRELIRTLSTLDVPRRCLDYGCGAGQQMRRLRQLGAEQVVGFDPDPLARAASASTGLPIFACERAALQAGPYDLILLDHVIEHLPDPEARLRLLLRALAPGGILLLRTPNTGSALARLFGSSWRGWETPRHLNLFSSTSLAKLAERLCDESFMLEHLGSSNRMFLGMFHGSFHSVRWLSPLGKLIRHTVAAVGWPLLEAMRIGLSPLGLLSGEELHAGFRRRK